MDKFWKSLGGLGGKETDSDEEKISRGKKYALYGGGFLLATVLLMRWTRKPQTVIVKK